MTVKITDFPSSLVGEKDCWMKIMVVLHAIVDLVADLRIDSDDPGIYWLICF